MPLPPKPGKKASTRDVMMMSLQLVFGVIVGVLVCAGWLIAKPVTVLDGPPAADRVAEDRHEVLYVRGKMPTRSNQGAKKMRAFLDRSPGAFIFSEEDVNRWMASSFSSQERTTEISGVGVTLAAGVPAVRIRDDEMEIGVEIGLERNKESRTIVAQTRGRFIGRGDRQVFVPRSILLGSCPLPWNLGGRFVYEKLRGLYPPAENMQTAWAAVGEARASEGRLHLVIPGATVTPAAVPASAPAAEPGELSPAPETTETPATPEETAAVPAESDTAESVPSAPSPTEQPTGAADESPAP